MQVEFVGQSAADPDNTWANTSRLINCYREPVGDGRFVLKSVLGQTRLTTVPGVFCRAMAEIEGMLYVAQGGRLFSISDIGVVTEYGDITDSAETTISGNNGKITIAAGGDYYVLSSGVLSQPAAGAFSDFGSVTFFGQLTVLTERDGRRVQWSNAADPETLGGLDFATTEARDDNVLRALPVAGQLWMFKEGSIEPWLQNGADLQAIRGATIERGLKGFNLLSSIPDGAMFVGNDNKARLAPSMTVISNVAVETSIAQEGPERVIYYQDEGHEFCAIIFPNRPAWVFDLFTGEWHERREGPSEGSWSARASALAHGRFYVCNDLGILSYLERTNVDDGNPMIREAVGRTVENQENRFRVSKFEILANVGRSTTIEPTVELHVSRDRGQTYVDARSRSLGTVGNYQDRTAWRQLGHFGKFTPKITWGDPVDVNIAAMAWVEIT